MIRLALLGDPVGHSLSPFIQEAALRALGIPGTYVARRVDREGFLRACFELRSGDLDGANVTMPHKQLAADTVDELSADAARAVSVNTLLVRGGRLQGHSTDVSGIRVVWEAGGLPADAPVLILGAGGAAAAALVALNGHDITVSARRLDAARALLTRIEAAGRAVEWGSGLPGAVVVNATPLGMHDESLPPAVLAAAGGLLDMTYGPHPTRAVATARARQLPTVDGIEFLLAQAAVSFELWTGLPAPRQAMAAAVQKAQARA